MFPPAEEWEARLGRVLLLVREEDVLHVGQLVGQVEGEDVVCHVAPTFTAQGGARARDFLLTEHMVMIYSLTF